MAVPIRCESCSAAKGSITKGCGRRHGFCKDNGSMLRKPHRLRQSQRFTEVKRKGQSTTHRLVVLTGLPNGLTYSRFGFSVSRYIGGAVKRNRVKRLMREAVRSRIEQIARGYDLVFVARNPIRHASSGEIHHAITKLLDRVGLLLPSAYIENAIETNEDNRTASDQVLSENHLKDAAP